MFGTIGYYICVPFAALLRLFYNLTSSYGLSLIFFTLVIKLILLPFQMKSKKSMVRMSRMNGRMQEIQAKYKNNAAKMNEEMQKLYEEEGVSPMSGCLWSFLPMPILIALYQIIQKPITYFMSLGGRTKANEVLEAARATIEAAGVELTGNVGYEQIEICKVINNQFPDFAASTEGWMNINYNFLGIDLTNVPWDHFSDFSNGITWALVGLMLIPILSGALSFLLSKVSMGSQPQGNAAAAGSTRTMMLMMPLMSVYIGFILPAALGVYWIAQSAFSIVQEYIMGKFFNEKLQAEEDARYEARQAERQKRMEEARQRQREHQQQEKLSLKEKRAAAQAAKAKKAEKAATSTTEAGRVGDRPYAKGRAYREDRYDS